jgi:hypothetical protein
MPKLTEEQVVALQKIAHEKRLETTISRNLVRPWDNDLQSIYGLCCEIADKPRLTTPEIPNALLGDQGTAVMRAWAICPYDFWDILCTACTLLPDESVEIAVQVAIKGLAHTFWERSKSCGLSEGMAINDLTVKQAIQLTVLGAIRWDHRLNHGQGDSAYSPLYTRGWGLAQSPIAKALRR